MKKYWMVIILIIVLSGCTNSKVEDDVYSTEKSIKDYFPVEIMSLKYSGGFEGAGYR